MDDRLFAQPEACASIQESSEDSEVCFSLRALMISLGISQKRA
jgi:hypothetical protein